ncbi:hypothetical protein GCM10009096_17410 [Parasphingorhabdus litoris]|uniref:Uncharacterized protein n=1 Tax=Parasphingorhabdus litoris TaxID=394733 RepID=A0ABP3KC48_9SPHN
MDKERRDMTTLLVGKYGWLLFSKAPYAGKSDFNALYNCFAARGKPKRNISLMRSPG